VAGPPFVQGRRKNVCHHAFGTGAALVVDQSRSARIRRFNRTSGGYPRPLLGTGQMDRRRIEACAYAARTGSVDSKVLRTSACQIASKGPRKVVAEEKSSTAKKAALTLAGYGKRGELTFAIHAAPQGSGAGQGERHHPEIHFGVYKFEAHKELAVALPPHVSHTGFRGSAGIFIYN
jgi:hypothetical protein